MTDLVDRQKIIEEFHRGLESGGGLTSEFFARLRQEMTGRRIVYGDRPLGISLRPHLLTRRQYDELARASEILVGALDKVAAALLSSPSLLDTVGLTDMERELALIDPGYSQTAVTTRLDAFTHANGIRFVEYNAENPSSLTDQAGLNQVLFGVPALQSLAARYRLHQFAPEASLLESLLAAFREWGGVGAPNVAIVDWEGLPTESEFFLLRNYFVGRGVPAIICSPDELEYRNGRLYKEDFHVDLVYKRVLIHEFLARYGTRHPLIEAYRARQVCLVNPFRCKLLHKKASFEMLTDEAFQGWFTQAEKEIIASSVPWTRRFAPRKTAYRGMLVDLVEHVRKNREAFVLKPNDDYGGHGVTIGRHVSEGEWEAALEGALGRDFIVQEAVELSEEEFPVFDEAQWALQPMYVDTNPFIFGGRVEGAMVRLSNSAVVNVTSGGGMTGFFVIEGEVES
jgi:hypothetical protein